MSSWDVMKPTRPSPLPPRGDREPAPPSKPPKLRVVVHNTTGAHDRKVKIVSINGEPCYRIWPWGRGEGWRWSRDLLYWPDDGVGHDPGHGKKYSYEDAIAACVEHYMTRRVRAQAREPREESDIE